MVPGIQCEVRGSGASRIAPRFFSVSLLWEAAGILLTSNDPDSMLHGIFERMRDQLGLDAYFNFMIETPGATLRLKSYAGIPEEEAQRISRLEFGQAICGTAALRQAPINVNSIQESDEPMVQLVKEYGIRACACNPLIAGERLIGTLSFASRTKDSFSGAELEFFETISRYIAVAYERLHLVGQLREADRHRDEFLAMLAHELRNPLAPIRNAAQVLMRICPPDSQLQQMRSMIERQVTHMTRLVDDLPNVSRITQNKITLRKEKLELMTIVGTAVETSRSLIDARKHRLTVSLTGPAPIEGDPTRLAQVISNLLNNAAKYTEEGGSILLTAEKDGAEVVMRVKDDGMGISPDALPHVFDLFTQADRSLDHSQGGLGIGLTLVRRLVEMHGGRVEALSDGPGKGSEFVVRLPLLMRATSEEEPGPAKVGGEGVQRPATCCRALVVDDNVDSAESTSNLTATRWRWRTMGQARLRWR